MMEHVRSSHGLNLGESLTCGVHVLQELLEIVGQPPLRLRVEAVVERGVDDHAEVADCLKREPIIRTIDR